MTDLINTYVCGDTFDYLPRLEDRSVDLLFTSIPDVSETDFDKDVDGYTDFIERALEQCSRIVKDDGFLVFIQTDRKMDGQVILKHKIIADYLFDRGLHVKDYKIISKGPADKVNLYVLNFSHFMAFTKTGKVPVEKRTGYYLRDIWEFAPVDTCYFNQTFSDLVVSIYSEEGDLVVDPFAGRGTVCKSAHHKGRRYFGAEISPDVYDGQFNQMTKFF